MRCDLCPVKCGADREIRAGACGTRGMLVAKAYLHAFEEPPICHTNGAGAVFFGGCALRCVFCQNYEISLTARGKETSPAELAEIFRRLEAQGADVLDLVTPDHIVPYLLETFSLYRPKIPVVYNTGAYCLVETLKTIDPYIDVYLPDFKFASPDLAFRYTGRRDYPEIAREAISFMAKKPFVYENGRMLSGILTRHLVMPSCTSDSLNVLGILKEILPTGAPLSLMRQYTPMRTLDFPELNRSVTAREYGRVKDYALALGFDLFTQGKESADAAFVPDWTTD